MFDLSNFLGMPLDASGHGAPIDAAMSWVHWLMLALFLFWAPFFLYTLYRFRAKKQPEANYRGVTSKFSTYIEGAVIVAETILLVGFAFPIWGSIKNDFPPAENSLVINLIAEQFAWNVIYPGPDGEFGRTTLTKPIQIDSSDPNGADDIIVADELHLVKGKPTIIELSSRDVIHSFGLPNMRVKQDVIPGLKIPVWFVPEMSTAEFREQMKKTMTIEADQQRRRQYPPYRWIAMQDYTAAGDTLSAGSRLTTRWLDRLFEAGITEVLAAPDMEINCAQLCGGGHYSMRGTLIVHETQAEFDARLQELDF